MRHLVSQHLSIVSYFKAKSTSALLLSGVTLESCRKGATEMNAVSNPAQTSRQFKTALYCLFSRIAVSCGRCRTLSSVHTRALSSGGHLEESRAIFGKGVFI